MVFDCLGGSNTEDFSTPMKEDAEYIGRKFDYGTDIHRLLDNEMKTGIPVPSSPISTEADRALSRNQKFTWGNNMVEYFKHETKLDKN